MVSIAFKADGCVWRADSAAGAVGGATRADGGSGGRVAREVHRRGG